MADNYLEKKMDELRAKRPSAFARPNSGKQETEAFLIISDDFSILSEKVTSLCKERRKVAFIFSDWISGSRLAQATGARFYPSYPEKEAEKDLVSRWNLPIRIIRL